MMSMMISGRYFYRISCILVIAFSVGLVLHGVVKYRRYPFGLGGTSYYHFGREGGDYFEITDDELFGGFYDAGFDSKQSRPVSRGRSLETFCLDGSPLPPRPSKKHSNNNQQQHDDISSSMTTTSNTPSYHILNSNFSMMTVSLESVAHEIKSKYNDLLQATINNRGPGSCRPKVIEYRCAGNAQSSCGGMGDRLRGVAAAFFMSLLTNSVFSLNWDYPVNLEAFFEPAFLSRELLFEQLYGNEKPSEIVIPVVDREEDVYYLLSNIPRMRWLLKHYDVIAFEINSLVPLEVLLSHPYFRSLAAYYDITNFSYSEIFSIALRILLPRFTPRLADAVAPYIEELKSPKYDARFGIQIRLGSPEWNEYDRVGLSQVHCFVDEVKNISRTNGYKRLLIFVTADSDRAMKEVSRLVGKMFDKNSEGQGMSAKVITADNIAKITHIDRTSFSRHQGAESAALRTFADWAILAAREMDHLIISRSSFGETAGMLHMSAKSIRRLAHNITDACVFHDYAMTSVYMEAGAISTYSCSLTAAIFMLLLPLFWQINC